jgi:DNA-directed RNA polymerase sigma subunit (sigma70/sigma32)
MKKGQILWERKLNNEFPLPTLEEELGLRLVEDFDVPVDHDFETGILAEQVLGIMKDAATPRETHAVRIRYLYDKTLQETGKQFDVSPVRIGQVITKGIRKTRTKLNITKW